MTGNNLKRQAILDYEKATDDFYKVHFLGQPVHVYIHVIDVVYGTASTCYYAFRWRPCAGLDGR